MATTHEPVREPRWRRLPEERPRQLIEAALEIFGERGLAAARLEDIARRAGVSKGTIYLYFPNKEALFCDMLRQMVVSTITEAQAALDPHASAHAQLHEYLRLMWNYVRSPTFEKLHRLATSELHNFPALLEFYVEEVAMRSMRIIADIVRHGIETGEFRAVDPTVAARVFHAMVIKHGIWCAQRETIPFLQSTTDEQVRDELFDFFLHGLRNQHSA